MSPTAPDAPVSSPAASATGGTPGVPTRVEGAERRGDGRRALDRRVLAVVEGMSDAFIAIDAAWRVTYANREAARLNGTTAEALVGRDHWALWPETVGSEVERQYRRVVAERVPVQFEHHYRHADAWHDVRAYPADDGGLAVFYRDVTPQKRLEAERERQARDLADANAKTLAAETQFRLLVDRVRDYGVFLCDPDGIITHWGAGAQRIKGWTPAEAVGRHLRVLYPDDGSAEDGSAEAHIRHAVLHGEYIGEGQRQRKNGERFPARVVLTALRRDGQLVGFSKITQDLTGERDRQGVLEAAMRAAQAASIAKSQFLANTSHELRTPLNAVLGYAQLLEMELAGALTDQQRQYVARILGTSRHLLSLVNDVLDLARIEAGAMRPAHEAALAGDATAAAIQLVEPQASARQVVVVNGCAGRDGIAYDGDPQRVEQILVNLLSNAVRFTETGGRVTVTCGTTDHPPAEAALPPGRRWTFLRVEDTGVGIAPAELDRIWDAFVQVDASRTRRVGGSGLGLTISRHLARLMGGDITVRSVPGLGSTFVVWLPAPESPPPAAPAPTADDTQREDPQATVGDLPTAEGLRLAEVAAGLLAEAERVISTYSARLRVDPETPSAHPLGEAQVQDHGVTFVADVAQCLALVGEDGPQAVEMLRDGSAIQQLVASRHGEQRARLGWRVAEVRREYVVLREEIVAAVHRAGARGRPAETERAIGLVNHLLDQSATAALDAFERAAAEAGA